MKIVHVTPLYFPSLGGCELHVQRLSEGLAARGHQVTVFTSNVRDIRQLGAGVFGDLPETEFTGSIRVRRFRPDGGLLGSAFNGWQDHFRGSYRLLRLLLGRDGLDFVLGKSALLQLIPALISTQADLVLSTGWFYPSAYCVYLAQKLRRFPLAGMPLFHTAESWCGDRSVYRKMVSSCEVILANTEYEADFVRGLGAKRAEVVGVGIDPSSFENRDGQSIRRRYGLENYPVVGFVGRMTPNKGVLLLLRAMRSVWGWNPEVRFVFAGPGAGRKREIDTFIESLSEWEKRRIIVIDDFADVEKASLFDSFDVFALPSTGESFGIAYLEAWMCGKPVIGARIGPTQCVIDRGVDGLLVDPENPEDTARAVIEILSDPARGRQMGSCGRAKTIARFTWDKVVDRVERLYAELVYARQKHVNASWRRQSGRGVGHLSGQ